MTSKNLFFKQFRQDLEQRIWLPAIYFIVNFLAMDMVLMSEFERLSENAKYAARMKTFLMNQFFSPASAFTMLTIAVAVISALSGFAYMHSSKKLDVYHCLPIRRERLFVYQYINGIIYFIVPLVLHVLICLGICASNGMLGGVMVQAIGFVMIQTLFYLVFYATVILAVCLTGNIVISVLGSAILLLYSYMIPTIKYLLMARFFRTFHEVGDPLMESVAFSPVHMLYKLFDAINDDNFLYFSYTGYLDVYLKFFLMAVVYSVIAVLVYKQRPSESAGKTMAFAITEPVIKTMLVIPVTFCSGYMFEGIFGTSMSGGLGWYLFGCVFGFLFSCLLLEIIFRKDVKAILSHPKQIAFNGVLVAALLVIFHFDLTGFDSYLPADDKVESYAIRIGEISQIGVQGYYRSDETILFETMALEDDAAIRQLAAAGIDNAQKLKKNSTFVDEEARYTYLTMLYRMNNGKEVYRSYTVNVADPEIYQALSDIYADEGYKKAMYPVLANDNYKAFSGVNLNYGYFYETFTMDADCMEQLIQAYRQELSALTLDEICSEYPVAEMAFMGIYDSEREFDYPQAVYNTTAYDDNQDLVELEWGYYVYPSFTNTIALLKEFGAEFTTSPAPEAVTNVVVRDYSQEVLDDDGYWTKLMVAEYSVEAGQEQEIAELMKGVVPDMLLGDMSDFYQGKVKSRYEENIEVEVTYYDEGVPKTEYCRFKVDQMPEFVRNDFKASEY